MRGTRRTTLEAALMGGWQLWLTSAVIAAMVTGLMNLPKIRGEGRQASSAGQLSLTEAQIKAQQNALASAESAASRAEVACSKCEAARETMEENFKKFIGFVDDEIVALLPDPAARARLRAAIRDAWQGL